MDTLTTANETIDVVRVFYYRYPRFGFMAKATRDYQRCFGIEDVESNHVSLQLGSKVYEVSLEGTSCYNYSDELLLDRNLVGFYECDISECPDDVKRAARFTLDYDVLTNRKLATKDCLKYLKQWLLRDKRIQAWHCDPDYNLEPGTIANTRFNMPFTCATQVATTFARIFGLEPIADSHLPTAILWMTLAMADSGIGQFLQATDSYLI